MKVKEIMSTDIKSLSPDDNVSKLIPLIEKNQLRQIVIADKNNFRGIIYSKDIAERNIRDPAKIKIGSLIENSPTVSPEQEVEEAANLMFNSNLRILPVVEDKKFIGILFMEKIIESATDSFAFKETRAEEIMSDPVFISDDEDIGKARIVMRESGVSRLPVVDKNKKLVGVVTIFDLLRAVKPTDRINFYSMAGEREKITGIKVSSIMNKNPVISQRNSTLSEIANLMLKKNTEGVIVTENDSLVGIISMKDLLESYIYGLGEKGVFYQIIGIDEQDDEFILSTVERMVTDTIKKISKIFEPHFFFIHVKKYSKKGKIKYSIRARMKTSKKTFISQSYAWDLRDAVDEALDKLERIIKKEKKDYRSVKKQIRKLKKFSG